MSVNRRASRFIAALLCALAVGALTLSSPATAKVDLSDVGEVKMKNKGARKAQQPFLHGLAQLHNFEYGFAREDFQKAQEIDPDFALAYWGEAMTHNHPIWQEQDREAALTALAKFAPTAQERQAKARSALARDLLAAVDVLYGEGTKFERDELYRDAMGALYAKHPDNVEIAAFYALSIMGSAHYGRDEALYMQSAAITEDFIRDYPRHPGIAHYLIHATDDPVHAPLGLIAARAYGDLAPNAGHAQHMTTHIFLALGDWDGVIKNNIRASQIVDENRAKNGRGPAGCGHYTSWLMYGYLQKAETVKAAAIMDLCFQNVRELEGRYVRGYFAWQRSLYLLDTEDWQGPVAKMAADYKQFSGPLLEHQVMDGWVAVKIGDLDAARDHLASARESHKRLMAWWDKEALGPNDPDRKEPIVQLLQLEALIAEADGKTDKALSLLKEAVAMEDDMPFGFGPPSPAKPSLELLGETMVKSGDFESAVPILERALSRTPNRKKTLEALAMARESLTVEAGAGD